MPSHRAARVEPLVGVSTEDAARARKGDGRCTAGDDVSTCGGRCVPRALVPPSPRPGDAEEDGEGDDVAAAVAAAAADRGDDDDGGCATWCGSRRGVRSGVPCRVERVGRRGVRRGVMLAEESRGLPPAAERDTSRILTPRAPRRACCRWWRAGEDTDVGAGAGAGAAGDGMAAPCTSRRAAARRFAADPAGESNPDGFALRERPSGCEGESDTLWRGALPLA